jgi:hypothetical protein
VTDFGTVRRDGSVGVVRFERVYGAAPEELWSAWTTPERLTRWLGASVSGPIEPGAAVTLAWGDDPDSQVALEIVELTPVPEGTRLVLDHERLPVPMLAGLAAGWHAYLDALAAGDASGWDARWAELLPAYKERVAEL